MIEYAEQVTRDANRVPDDLFGRLRAEFSAAQIVELTLRITLCSFYNKFNQALRIDIEDEAVAAFAAVRARS
ncbi:MAG: carboxymuconolactone decarboxylase family protein [Chloroflexota bacterium]